MPITSVYTLITTDKVRQCRDFYVEHFGFSVEFASTVFVQLQTATEDGGLMTLAFMPPNELFGGDYREQFNGRGAYITIEVTDARAEFERLRSAGVEIIADLEDSPWGQRHFLLRDPHGTVVDVSEPTEPAAGWYDPYQAEDAG